MINHNGKVLPDSKVALHPENRGLHYGDAVFETIKVSAGQVLYWEDHYFRLMAAMRVMRMEIPMSFTYEFLEEEIKKTIEANSKEATAYRIKLLVWRSWGGKYTPRTKTVEYLITAEVLDETFYTLNEANYEVELFKDHYINSGLLSTLKTTNRAINVLAGIYAKENEYQNCLLLNENKQVIEALNGNLFLVDGDKIKTPPLTDGCLNGIIRKQLITILRQLPDYTFEEASISPFELQKADELFVTNCIVGIQPISKFRKKLYATTVTKDLLAKLNVKTRLG